MLKEQCFNPYMYHYVAESTIKLNLLNEAKEYIKKYLNGMVELGADTFYDVFVRENHEFPPYKDRKMNSMLYSCIFYKKIF